mmetsp:Transcript_18159/g.59627  ORF Transcript_18159/g.59627 Transcript_18159/m.59627 type:complete len:210 (-) Transcript_18159:1912-2541(-)
MGSHSPAVQQCRIPAGRVWTFLVCCWSNDPGHPVRDSGHRNQEEVSCHPHGARGCAGPLGCRRAHGLPLLLHSHQPHRHGHVDLGRSSDSRGADGCERLCCKLLDPYSCLRLHRLWRVEGNLLRLLHAHCHHLHRSSHLHVEDLRGPLGHRKQRQDVRQLGMRCHQESEHHRLGVCHWQQPWKSLDHVVARRSYLRYRQHRRKLRHGLR